MGFNKRYVSKETILTTLENKDSLIKLFSSDAIILMDKFSTKIFKLLNNGMKEKEVIKVIKDGGKKD